SLRLQFYLPKNSYWVGESLRGQVALENAGGEPVVIHALEPALVGLEMTDAYGRPVSCAPPRVEPAAANLTTLPAGQRAYAEVLIGDRCGALAGGEYTVRAFVDLDGPWGAFGVFAVRG